MAFVIAPVKNRKVEPEHLCGDPRFHVRRTDKVSKFGIPLEDYGNDLMHLKVREQEAHMRAVGLLCERLEVLPQFNALLQEIAPLSDTNIERVLVRERVRTVVDRPSQMDVRSFTGSTAKSFRIHLPQMIPKLFLKESFDKLYNSNVARAALIENLKKWREERIAAYDFTITNKILKRNNGYAPPEEVTLSPTLSPKFMEFMEDRRSKWSEEVEELEQWLEKLEKLEDDEEEQDENKEKETTEEEKNLFSDIYAKWLNDVQEVFVEYIDIIFRIECNYKKEDVIRARLKKENPATSFARQASVIHHNGRAHHQQLINTIFTNDNLTIDEKRMEVEQLIDFIDVELHDWDVKCRYSVSYYFGADYHHQLVEHVPEILRRFKDFMILCNESFEYVNSLHKHIAQRKTNMGGGMNPTSVHYKMMTVLCTKYQRI